MVVTKEQPHGPGNDAAYQCSLVECEDHLAIKAPKAHWQFKMETTPGAPVRDPLKVLTKRGLDRSRKRKVNSTKTF